ncbi:uncharacterized protein LOC143542151 [Bidens hawaiensis]|uniref:uncharacterized protein LOC143542151 n=1 Tax=Bidens hawaiensis TaxID=980011 RepID=UPI00404BA230
MTKFLFAKNKIGFTDGTTLKKPESSSPDYMSWMRCDAMIKGWLTTAMEKTIRSRVKYANTSTEIWSDILERFRKENAPRAYELRQQIAVTRQEGAFVSAYFTKLRSLWDEAESVQPTPHYSCSGCSCSIRKRLTEH